MDTIEAKAEEVKALGNPTHLDQDEYGSIIIILMIVSIIVSVLRLMQSCKKSSQDIIDSSAHPTIFEELTLRKYVYAALRKHPGAYYKYGRSLANAIFVVGSKCTVDEIVKIMEESDINNTPSFDVRFINEENL